MITLRRMGRPSDIADTVVGSMGYRCYSPTACSSVNRGPSTQRG